LRHFSSLRLLYKHRQEWIDPAYDQFREQATREKSWEIMKWLTYQNDNPLKKLASLASYQILRYKWHRAKKRFGL